MTTAENEPSSSENRDIAGKLGFSAVASLATFGETRNLFASIIVGTATYVSLSGIYRAGDALRTLREQNTPSLDVEAESLNDTV